MDTSLDAALARIKADAPCAGAFARVIVWKDADGQVARLEFRGDLSVCSHPPLVWYDAAGNRLEVVPEEPVVPGSERARHFADVRARHTDGHTESGSVPLP